MSGIALMIFTPRPETLMDRPEIRLDLAGIDILATIIAADRQHHDPRAGRRIGNTSRASMPPVVSPDMPAFATE